MICNPTQYRQITDSLIFQTITVLDLSYVTINQAKDIDINN
jgi:hypothetical protein